MNDLTAYEMIKFALAKKGKTIKEMCEDLNISYKYIINSMRIKKIGDGKLMLMAEYLDLDYRELVKASPKSKKKG